MTTPRGQETEEHEQSKLKRLATNPRILILATAVLLSLISLGPSFADGITVQNVAPSGPAANATPQPIDASTTPTIQRFNGETVSSAEQFYQLVQEQEPNSTVTLTAGEQQYFVQVVEQNGTKTVGLTVANKARTNLQLGLDLAGGTRVILEPAEPVNSSEQQRILNNLEQRINAFGLSDAQVTSAADLSGGEFIIVEVPGVSRESIVDLLRQQGRFEAEIANQTIFTGDQIQYICRESSCSGLTANGCQQRQTGDWACQHRFSITISDEAAKHKQTRPQD